MNSPWAVGLWLRGVVAMDAAPLTVCADAYDRPVLCEGPMAQRNYAGDPPAEMENIYS